VRVFVAHTGKAAAAREFERGMITQIEKAEFWCDVFRRKDSLLVD
jgi:hypothetical protein